MKNSLRFTFLLAVYGMMLSLQTIAQDQKKETKKIRDFTALKVMSGIDVYLSQSDAPSVKISVDSKETLEDLVVEVDNSNTLVIKLNSKSTWRFFSFGPRVKAYVSFAQLNSIQVSGGSDLFGQGVLEFNRLRMSASGGSDIKINLKANELEVKCSGGSDAELQGYAAYFKGMASGGSDIKAQELEASVAEISASGGSDVHVKASKELTASANGGSDVVYYGNPATVNSNASGGSDIKKR